MRLTFRPPYTPPIEKTVSFARPSRSESAIFNLLHCVLETLKTQEGFVAASLFVSAADRLGDGQPSLIDAEEERHAAELDHLVERLQARRILQWARLVGIASSRNALSPAVTALSRLRHWNRILLSYL